MNLFVVWGGGGVPILGTVTKKVQSQKEAPFVFRITPGAGGLNRQIRRMCEHFGYEVKKAGTYAHYERQLKRHSAG